MAGGPVGNVFPISVIRVEGSDPQPCDASSAGAQLLRLYGTQKFDNTNITVVINDEEAYTAAMAIEGSSQRVRHLQVLARCSAARPQPLGGRRRKWSAPLG